MPINAVKTRVSRFETDAALESVLDDQCFGIDAIYALYPKLFSPCDPIEISPGHKHRVGYGQRFSKMMVLCVGNRLKYYKRHQQPIQSIECKKKQGDLMILFHRNTKKSMDNTVLIRRLLRVIFTHDKTIGIRARNDTAKCGNCDRNMVLCV